MERRFGNYQFGNAETAFYYIRYNSTTMRQLEINEIFLTSFQFTLPMFKSSQPFVLRFLSLNKEQTKRQKTSKYE